jgi:hypothetical protein
MPTRYKSVYISYPRGVQTGGPEALHQLGAALRQLGTPAFLVPLADTVSRPRVPEYEHYGVPEAERVVDLAENAFICPENRFFELTKYRRVDRFCWWLSVDNFRFSRSKRRLATPSPGGFQENLHRAADRLIAPWESAMLTLALRLHVQHLAQSAYAWSFLHSRTGVPPSMLSDYTSEPTTTGRPPLRDPRQIAFNFAKGGDVVKQIIETNAVDANWVPIRNMTHGEVIQTLQSSSIYLDLGHQPGKDRLPREAAANGAVTIVARTGAGAFSSDFPLPYDHKIVAGKSGTECTSTVLNAILSDLDHQYHRQATFRHAIELEKQIFLREVQRIFIDRQFGSDLEIEREL